MEEITTRVVRGYTVEIERAYDKNGRPSNYSAFVRNLGGVYATGKTIEQIVKRMETAIEWQIEALQAMGQPVPPPDAPEGVAREHSAAG